MPVFKPEEVKDWSGDSAQAYKVKRILELKDKISELETELKAEIKTLERNMGGEGAVCVGPDLFWGIYHTSSKLVPDMEKIEEEFPEMKLTRLDIEKRQHELQDSIATVIDVTGKQFLKEKKGKKYSRQLKEIEIEVSDGETVKVTDSVELAEAKKRR